MQIQQVLTLAVLFFVCGWVSYTDIRRTDIDYTPLCIGAAAALVSALTGNAAVTPVQALTGFAVMFVLFFIVSFFGMGGGDVKLFAVIGLFLGAGPSLMAAEAAFIVGVPLSLAYAFWRKKKKGYTGRIGKMAVPLAPAITAGTYISVLGYSEFMRLFFSNTVTVTGG